MTICDLSMPPLDGNCLRGILPFEKSPASSILRDREKFKAEYEASSVVITPQNPYLTDLEQFIRDQEILILKRNKIYHNPIKRFFFRKKLKEIDSTLDQLDFKIYELEKKGGSMEDLEKIFLAAQERMAKYRD